jgi:hypothetical protein
MNPARQRTWGLRFSGSDGLILLCFTGGATGLWRMHSELWWMLLIVAGHFFVFCNVFRITRPKELAWAALFLVNTCAWFVSGRLEWLPVLLTQLPISILVIAAEIRSPRYHGILAQRWNTNLGDYLEGRIP